jgi:hypothetical protein
MGRIRFLLLLITAIGSTGIRDNARAGQASDNLLVDELTSELVGLPRRDIRPLKETLHKLFGDADQAQLTQLAEHPNWNVAM